MRPTKWQTQKVNGRDAVLLDIEKRSGVYNKTILQDVRAVMNDYEVDMYRLVMNIGKRYGMNTAYEIMSDTVAEKRLKWLDQVKAELELNGSEVANGLCLYLKYFSPKSTDFILVEQTIERVVFKRKDFVNAISHACSVLGLDVIEVNNKVYARAMNVLFKNVGLSLEHVFLAYQDGWYDEMIEDVS